MLKNALIHKFDIHLNPGDGYIKKYFFELTLLVALSPEAVSNVTSPTYAPY